MKTLITLMSTLFLSVLAMAQTGTVKGTVMGSDGLALIGASVVVDGTAKGTTTDVNGEFSLDLEPGTQTLVMRYLGYADSFQEVEVTAGQTVTLNVTLNIGTAMDEVVVSGSKKPEKLTESPATIETVFAREIEEYAGNPGELIARQKGIDYFRAGIATPAFNIRGFNSNFNAKNLQVADGRFSTLIATGLPFGPLSTTIREDIERVEVILGPNATLYGPNAHNGLLNTITKDPRTSAGTIIALNPGVSGDGAAFFSGRVRHAQVVNDWFSFKVMGEYTFGEEFEYADSVFIDRVGALDSLGNPIPDGVQEGYPELELDPNVNFAKAEAALYFSPTDDLDIIFNTGFSNSNYLAPTNVGRNQIQDWMIQYYQLRASGKNWFAQAYYTRSKTDSTYAIDQRTKNYYAAIDAGVPVETALQSSYGNGAIFQDNSDRLNAEAQFNERFGDLEIVTGVQYQMDRANSLGSYLLDSDGEIVINQVGAYAHFTYDFGDSGFRGLAAARADYHEVYEFNFVPKLGLLHVSDKGTFRFTYGQGIAAPTILNLYGNLFAGLILGNAEGFTLADGTVIENQKVEKIQTFELGYRGQIVKNKVFLDANAYYNISTDFLSPLTVLGVATQRGDTPIEEAQGAGFDIWNGLVASYINFGKVNTFGIDLGATVYFNPQFSANVNYSYFDFAVDENDLDNDFNGDGEVNFLDILVNAPTHKLGAGLNYSGKKWFGSLFARWVQEYNYFSSFQIASETLVREDGTPFLYRGVPIVENARSADTFNFGPLGGFVTADLAIGYRVSDYITVSAAASNLFNQDLREFTAAPPTRGLYTVELKFKLPAVKPRQ